MNANLELLTIGRLAAELDVSDETLRARVRKGTLKPDAIALGTPLRPPMALFKRATASRLAAEIRREVAPTLM